MHNEYNKYPERKSSCVLLHESRNARYAALWACYVRVPGFMMSEYCARGLAREEERELGGDRVPFVWVGEEYIITDRQTDMNT